MQKIEQSTETTIHDLPEECIIEILNKLPYYDALSFRKTSYFIGNTFYKFMHDMQGRKLEIFLNIRNDQIMIRYRSPLHRLDNAQEIAETSWANVLTNAICVLHIRLGSNILTDQCVDRITDTFSKSILKTVFLYAHSAQQNMFELLKRLNGEHSQIAIKRLELREITEFYPQITGIKIGNEVMFFDFDTLMNNHPNLPHLKINLTLAAVPQLRNCIDQWKNKERDIVYWDIFLPAFNFLDTGDQNRETDWRRSVVLQNGIASLTISVEFDGPTPAETRYIRLRIVKTNQ